MEGIVYLYYGDEIIRQKRYHSPTVRRKIIEEWRLEIGRLFCKMAIQIAPILRKKKIEKEEVIAPIKRFPATYNNIPVYRY